MTITKSKLIALFTGTMLFCGMANAQESVNASGNDATGAGGSVAYSVGQVIYTTNSSASGSIAQGVQHAYEIFTIGIKETILDISLSVFPNPTDENLILKIGKYNHEKLTYQVYDMNGKLINNEQVVAQQTKINISHLPSSTYFIRVVNQANNQIQSFKIIKTQ